MNLHAEITSERGKALNKTGNDFINIDLTVHRQKVGAIELYLFKDTEDGESTTDEWLIKYYKNEDEDPIIIAQGNLEPKVKEHKHHWKYIPPNMRKCLTCGMFLQG